MSAPAAKARASLMQELDRLSGLGLLRPYMPVREATSGSGGRPWRRRLLRLDLATVQTNIGLGVRYAPLRALGRPNPFDSPFRTSEQVLGDLVRTGAILAAPPPPAWAIAVLAPRRVPEIAWLAPLPPVVYTAAPRIGLM